MNISVLGSTGSIGVQTLDVARMHGIKVTALTANKSIELLEKQAREFMPEMVGVLDEKSAEMLKISLADTNIKVIGGKEGILAAAQYEKADTVVEHDAFLDPGSSGGPVFNESMALCGMNIGGEFDRWDHFEAGFMLDTPQLQSCIDDWKASR